jgi:hypothetical protein
MDHEFMSCGTAVSAELSAVGSQWVLVLAFEAFTDSLYIFEITWIQIMMLSNVRANMSQI